MRKHVNKEIKHKTHQREEKVSASPAKRAKSEPFAIEDFYFDNEMPMENFNGDSPDLRVSRVSPNRVMKPETKIEMKPSKLKEDDKVKEKEESEEPPKWFQAYAEAAVGRLEKLLNVTMEKVEELKNTKIEKEQPKE